MAAVKDWWQYSLLARVWGWGQSLVKNSLLVSVPVLAIWLLVLIVCLPYLSTSQIGLFLIAITLFYLPLAQPSSLQLPIFTYSFVATLSTLFSPVRSAAADGLVKLLLYFAVFLAIERVLTAQPKYRHYLVGGYILTNLPVVVLGLRQQFFGAQQLATWWDPTSELSSLTRVYSFLGNPNLLAGYLLAAIPLGVVATLLTPRWTWKLVVIISTLGSLLCIIYSYSRGAWLGLGAEILVLSLALLYWRWPRLPIGSAPGVGAGLVAAMAGAVMSKPSLRLRVLSIFSLFNRNVDQSISFRLRVMQGAIEIVKHYPILGIGPGNRAFNLVYPLFQKARHSALGAYAVPLEMLIETGFVGLFAYGWLLATVLRRGLQSIRQEPNLWGIAGLSIVVGMLVHGLADTVWYRPQVQVLWWLAIALIMVGEKGYETSSSGVNAPGTNG
ncbi:MAG: IctB family putative bicarbonate transporter [Pseudanabaenaceae cyanobacterium]